MRFIVSPGQRVFLLTKLEGGSPGELTSVIAKFNQGGDWAELLGEQYVIRGPANNLELWVTEDVAPWIEELRVTYAR